MLILKIASIKTKAIFAQSLSALLAIRSPKYILNLLPYKLRRLRRAIFV